MAGEIVFLDEQHLEPAPRRVARDRRAVDAAADDEEIEGVHGRLPTKPGFVIPAKAGISLLLTPPHKGQRDSGLRRNDEVGQGALMPADPIIVSAIIGAASLIFDAVLAKLPAARPL